MTKGWWVTLGLLALGSWAPAQGLLTNATDGVLQVGIPSNDSGSGKIELRVKGQQALLGTLDQPGSVLTLPAKGAYACTFVPAPGQAFLRRVEVGASGQKLKDVVQIKFYKLGWGLDSLRVLRKFANGLVLEPGPRDHEELDLTVRPAKAAELPAAPAGWARLVIANASTRPLYLALVVSDRKTPGRLRIGPDDPAAQPQSFEENTEWPLARGETTALLLSPELEGSARFILATAPVGLLDPKDKLQLAILKVAVGGAPALATLAGVEYGKGDQSLLTQVKVALPVPADRPPKLTLTDY